MKKMKRLTLISIVAACVLSSNAIAAPSIPFCSISTAPPYQKLGTTCKIGPADATWEGQESAIFESPKSGEDVVCTVNYKGTIDENNPGSISKKTVKFYLQYIIGPSQPTQNYLKDIEYQQSVTFPRLVGSDQRMEGYTLIDISANHPSFTTWPLAVITCKVSTSQ